MKIVVLDGYGLNPGDLSWNGLEALGELTVYDRTAPDELMERSSGAEVLITNKTVITAENMAALPALKYSGCSGCQGTRYYCDEYPCLQYCFCGTDGVCTSS